MLLLQCLVSNLYWRLIQWGCVLFKSFWFCITCWGQNLECSESVFPVLRIAQNRTFEIWNAKTLYKLRVHPFLATKNCFCQKQTTNTFLASTDWCRDGVFFQLYKFHLSSSALLQKPMLPLCSCFRTSLFQKNCFNLWKPPKRGLGAQQGLRQTFKNAQSSDEEVWIWAKLVTGRDTIGAQQLRNCSSAAQPLCNTLPCKPCKKGPALDN